MGSVQDKLNYLAGTKAAIKSALAAKGASISDSDTFRSYAGKISELKIGYEVGDLIPSDAIGTTIEADTILITNNVNSCGIFVEPDDSVSIAYGNSIRTHSPAGKLLNTLTFSALGNITNFTKDEQGYIYASFVDYTVRKFSPSGVQQWVFDTGLTYSINTLKVDHNKEVYFGGKTYAYKLSASGTRQWKYSAFDTVWGLDVDQNGYTYIGGYSLIGNNFTKLSPGGSKEWGKSMDMILDVALDNNGNIYVALTGNYVKKLDSSGSEQGKYFVSGGAGSVMVLPSNEVVIGSKKKDSKSNLSLYSNDGTLMKVLSIHTDTITSLSRDSKGNIYSGSYDSTLKKTSMGYRVLK